MIPIVSSYSEFSFLFLQQISSSLKPPFIALVSLVIHYECEYPVLSLEIFRFIPILDDFGGL